MGKAKVGEGAGAGGLAGLLRDVVWAYHVCLGREVRISRAGVVEYRPDPDYCRVGWRYGGTLDDYRVTPDGVRFVG